MANNLTILAARQAAILFAVSGLLAFAAVATQQDARATLVLVGVADILVALAAWYLPWDRWPHRVTALLAVPALAIIGFADRYGGASPYTYGLFFVILFAWIGVSQPPATALYLAPFATVAYVVPLVYAEKTSIEIQSTMVAIPVCVMVGELLSRTMKRLRDAERSSMKRASLLMVLARANDDIASLEQSQVIDRVLIAIGALGYDAASVDLIDQERGLYEVFQGHGLPVAYMNAEHPLDDRGLRALVIASDHSVVQTGIDSDPPIAQPLIEEGYRLVVGAPIRTGGSISAVLVGARFQEIPPDVEELEAFELLAAQSGRALQNAWAYEEQAAAARENAQAMLTDALTGIGSRRLANRLLDGLREGDAVALIDLDHFKTVNDTLGHAGGDRVLVQLGEYLRNQLRQGDGVARFGGEEFVVVIRNAKHLDELGVRLVSGWAAEKPATTFSAGLARHEPRTSPALTLAAADEAMYAAKRAGRSRAVVAPRGAPSSLETRSSATAS
ncbi:MAG: diguanylate cyclase [Actinomycetota bacterium]